VSYERSSSRNRAIERLSSLRQGFIYAKVRKKSLPNYARESIFYNCVFQLSATFEDFVADLLANWFAKVSALPAASSALPTSTRATVIARSLSDAFRLYGADGDETKLAMRIEASEATLRILQDAVEVSHVDFVDLLIKDKRFPSVRNFDKLFRRMGVSKIFAEVTKRVKSDFPLALQSFMDVRNAIAHEFPPNITDEDVERYFLNLSKWIAAVDRAMYSHVAAISGSVHWPR
jgi:hypothetical protein